MQTMIKWLEEKGLDSITRNHGTAEDGRELFKSELRWRQPPHVVLYNDTGTPHVVLYNDTGTPHVSVESIGWGLSPGEAYRALLSQIAGRMIYLPDNTKEVVPDFTRLFEERHINMLAEYVKFIPEDKVTHFIGTHMVVTLAEAPDNIKYRALKGLSMLLAGLELGIAKEIEDVGSSASDSVREVVTESMRSVRESLEMLDAALCTDRLDEGDILFDGAGGALAMLHYCLREGIYSFDTQGG